MSRLGPTGLAQLLTNIKTWVTTKLGNYVTTNTTQTITGKKLFTNSAIQLDNVTSMSGSTMFIDTSASAPRGAFPESNCRVGRIYIGDNTSYNGAWFIVDPTITSTKAYYRMVTTNPDNTDSTIFSIVWDSALEGARRRKNVSQGDILPSANNTYNLGSSDLKWDIGYIHNLIGTNKENASEDANSYYSTTSGSHMTFYTTSNGGTKLSNVPAAVNTHLESRTIRYLSSSDWIVEQICHNSFGLYYRKGTNGTWEDWKTFAFTNSNITGTAANVTGTVAIANGGTGATTRLNAVKNLTNESVGTPTHFLAITTNYAKAGYTTVAQAKTVLGITGDMGSHSDSEYVHKTGDESISGAKTFSNNITINGTYLGTESSTNERTNIYLLANRDTAEASGAYISRFRQNRTQGAMGSSDVSFISFDFLENSTRYTRCFTMGLTDWDSDGVPQTYWLSSTSGKGSLGTASTPWNKVYATNYYLGSTAFGDIVTHNASEFLASNGKAVEANKVQATIAAGATTALVQATVASNDCFRIAAGGAANAGWAEIATGDDANEPIYVRQYKGNFTTLQRTATLLDGSGNTSFPGQVTGVTFNGPLTWSGTTFSYNAGNSLYFYSGQPAIANCFEGSSNDFTKFSYPTGGTSVSSSNANIQTLRLDWGNTYWHDLFMSPNNNYLWHRNVVNSDARGWRRIVEENVTGLTDQSWNINIAGNATTVTGTAGTSTLAWGSEVTLYTVGGNAIKAKLPANPNSDTKNTAGSTDSSSKLFLIGATTQEANPQTYSHDTAYVGTDGCLYSGGAKVLTSHQSLSNYVTLNTAQEITNTKTFKDANTVVKRTDIEAGNTLPSADKLARNIFQDKNGKELGSIFYYKNTSGNTGLCLRAGDWFSESEGVYSLNASGTNRRAELVLYTNSSGDCCIQPNGYFSSTLKALSTSVWLGESTKPFGRVYANAFEFCNAGLLPDADVQTTEEHSVGFFGQNNTPLSYITFQKRPNLKDRIAIRIQTASSSYKSYDFDATCFYPESSNSVDIGSTTNIFKNIYCNNYYKGTTAFGDIVTHNASEFLTEHPSITLSTNTTSTASPAHGGTFTCIDSVTQDTNGHITKVNTKTVTLPSDNNTDTKVKQYEGTTNNERPILSRYNSTEASQTANFVVYDTGVTSNPAKHTITASGGFIGKLSGVPTGNTYVSAVKDGGALVNSQATSWGAIWRAPTKDYQVAGATWSNTNNYVYICYSVTNANAEAGTNTMAKSLIWAADTGTLTTTTFSGALSGNASTATQFSANTTVALTGDATGTSAGSKKGWSVPVTLANSGVTAGDYGPSADASPAHSGTFTVPSITVDAKGRVTAASTKTITLPADNNTDTKVTQTVTTANSAYPVLLCATANATETGTTTSRFSAGLTVNTRYGSIYMTNMYNTANTKGVRNSTTSYLNGAIIFRCYDASEMGRIHCESNKNGYQQIYMMASNYIKNGAISPEGTATTCYITVRVRDNGSKTIYTDGSWENSLTPYANNTHSLGTSSLQWKNAYAVNIYENGTALSSKYALNENFGKGTTTHLYINATDFPTGSGSSKSIQYNDAVDGTKLYVWHSVCNSSSILDINPTAAKVTSTTGQVWRYLGPRVYAAGLGHDSASPTGILGLFRRES